MKLFIASVAVGLAVLALPLFAYGGDCRRAKTQVIERVIVQDTDNHAQQYNYSQKQQVIERVIVQEPPVLREKVILREVAHPQRVIVQREFVQQDRHYNYGGATRGGVERVIVQQNQGFSGERQRQNFGGGGGGGFAANALDTLLSPQGILTIGGAAGGAALAGPLGAPAGAAIGAALGNVLGSGIQNGGGRSGFRR